MQELARKTRKNKPDKEKERADLKLQDQPYKLLPEKCLDIHKELYINSPTRDCKEDKNDKILPKEEIGKRKQRRKEKQLIEEGIEKEINEVK